MNLLLGVDLNIDVSEEYLLFKALSVNLLVIYNDADHVRKIPNFVFMYSMVKYHYSKNNYDGSTFELY